MSLTAEVITRGGVDTGNRVSNVHPEHWYRKIYKEAPVAASPVLALSQRFAREMSPSQKFNWWHQGFQALRGSILDVYTDSALSSAYASGGVVGTPLYFAMTAANAKQVVAGDVMLLVTATTGSERAVDVQSVQIGSDTTSYVLGTLMEADTSNRLAEATPTFRLLSSAYAEMSSLPDATARDLTEYGNQTQISMESLQLSGSELTEEERVDESKYRREKNDAFFRLRAKMERALLFNRYKVATVGGRPKRWTRGLIEAINTYYSGNIRSYVTDSDTAWNGKNWLAGGWDWVQDVLLDVSRYTDDSGQINSRLFMCGDLAHKALCDLARDEGLQMIDTQSRDWGIKVTKIHGLKADLEIHEHPLLSEDDAFRSCGLIYNPRWLTYIFKKGRDITFIPRGENVNGFTWVDGIKEGWMVEWGLKYHNLAGMAWVKGLGSTNTN